MRDSDINEGARWCLQQTSGGLLGLAAAWLERKGLDPKWQSEIAERAWLEGQREKPFTERAELRLFDRDHEYRTAIVHFDHGGLKWVTIFTQGVEPRPHLWHFSEIECLEACRLTTAEEEELATEAACRWFRAEYLNTYNGSTFLQEREALRLGLGGGSLEAVGVRR